MAVSLLAKARLAKSGMQASQPASQPLIAGTSNYCQRRGGEGYDGNRGGCGGACNEPNNNNVVNAQCAAREMAEGCAKGVMQCRLNPPT